MHIKNDMTLFHCINSLTDVQNVQALIGYWSHKTKDVANL